MLTRNKRKHIPLHIMIFPALVFVIIYQYFPIAGLAMAFQNFVPVKGFFRSEWVGTENFRYAFSLPNIWPVIRNTVLIAVMKIIAGQIVPIITALLLNEIRIQAFKRTIQSLVYLPHFLSWVILSGILIDVLSPSSGIVNQLLGYLGFKPIFFIGNEHVFPYTLVVSEVWKEYGFSTIVYMAALTGINPSLYEASMIDGAGRWKQTLHVTLPGMMPIIVLLATLSLGGILHAGFDQVFNLYSPQVYSTGDILGTLIYRVGLINAQYSLSAAISMIQSLVSFVMISLSYFLAYRLAGYRIF